ncbi:MAG TPA: Rieske (2Fe-2S) protein [Capsulimonadaceae bacterium]|nr:Rieske (2Fe-2S) protein [Capsulimonadaceae bacterium]
MSETRFTRRRFLQTLPMIAGAALLSRGVSFGAAQTASWIPIGKASDFPKGAVKRVTLPPTLNSEVIYVTHQANDTYLALWARCTHRGCVVDYNQPDQQYICPCHHGRFDTLGRNISGPPPRPLVLLNTQVDKSGNLSVQPPPANMPAGR